MATNLFGSAGASGTPTNITQYQTGFSEEIAPYAQELLGKTQALTDINQNPFQAYAGDRFAQFSPLQQQAFQNIAGITTSPYMNTAAQNMQTGIQGAMGTQYRFDPYQTQSFTAPGVQQQFMSPYMQGVVDVQQREAKRQADIAAQTAQGQAARAGAFGGTGMARLRSGAAADLQRNLANIQATGLQSAYQQGMQQFNQEQQARQAAAQLNAQQGQFGASLGLQGLQAGIQGAGMLGSLGQSQVAQQLAINQAQQQAGGVQQQQAQNILNAQYQQFLDRQNYPYKNLAFMSDIIRGAPLTQTGTTTYGAQPNALSQTAGLLTAGSQLFKAEGGMVDSRRPAGLAELAIYNMG